MNNLFKAGRILTGIAYLLLGYVHFKYAADDVKMVPSFLPYSIFWVYLVGIFWLATGASFISNILVRLSGLLSALMILVIIFTVQLKGLTSDANAMSFITLAFSIGLVAASLMVSSSGHYTCKKI